ncbi:flagellar biosynthesis regulator FlaF [Algimonas porphyrae]|uniref:Flagellar protein FlaF n=1 Tax=Algimonas porphyrae TaxID=1128113 RepID=A0ABQ5V3K6_9PROT|nr:flagellar biosynthesis regulator FlaF [Algimonas porphyrae]GLQ21428.1 hypothetical protein GCM10007854_23830 [Algimonas porphyrae]
MALMTSHAFNAQSAYGNMGQATGSGRDIEVRVFQTAIAKLTPYAGPEFKLTGDAAEVLSENLRLWDLLTVDLAHPDNETAPQLASQLLTLARFVRYHTHTLYTGSGTVDILLEINTAILQGLLGRPGQVADAQSAA